MKNNDLIEGLDKIRFTKNLTDIPLLFFVISAVIFFTLKALDMGEWFLPIYQLSFVGAFIGFAMTFVQHFIKCPNCTKRFNVKTNGPFFYFNIFTRKCLNCGIKVNKSNINDYDNNL